MLGGIKSPASKKMDFSIAEANQVMRLRELSPGDNFKLVRAGARYQVRQDQSGSSHYSVHCTRIINGKPFAKVYLNNQCLVEIASNDNE